MLDPQQRAWHAANERRAQAVLRLLGVDYARGAMATDEREPVRCVPPAPAQRPSKATARKARVRKARVVKPKPVRARKPKAPRPKAIRPPRPRRRTRAEFCPLAGLTARAKAQGLTFAQARYRETRDAHLSRCRDWQQRNREKVNAASRRYRERKRQEAGASQEQATV